MTQSLKITNTIDVADPMFLELLKEENDVCLLSNNTIDSTRLNDNVACKKEMESRVSFFNFCMSSLP